MNLRGKGFNMGTYYLTIELQDGDSLEFEDKTELSAEFFKQINEGKEIITLSEEDEDGNLILPFPEELLEAMGWGDGTTLDLDVIGDRLVIREVLPTDVEEDAVTAR